MCSLVGATGWAFSFAGILSAQCLGANVLPHANVHYHGVLDLNLAAQARVRRERVALTILRNQAFLVERKYLQRHKVIFLPLPLIYQAREFLGRRSDFFERALNNRKLFGAPIFAAQEPIAEFRHRNRRNSTSDPTAPAIEPAAHFFGRESLDE